MNVSDVSSVTIGLSAVPASVASFSVPLLLVDHADIPIDKIFRQVTRSTHATMLTASTDAENWCLALWGQTYNPAQAYIGRWIDTATASHAICENATTVAAAYAALTSTGQLGVLEAGGSVVDINPDFTGDTTMADVCASIQTAMSGAVASYTCALDALDRVVITSDNTGSSAAAVSLQTPAAGTDLTGAAYLGTEASVAGYDAEALGTAMARCLARDNTPFIICQRGETTAADVTAFSTVVNALDKICLLVCNDENAKDSGSSTDFPYLINALSHQKTHITYTEHNTSNGASADQHPDAAIIGEILVRLNKEGGVALSNNGMSSVSESGLDGDNSTVIPLIAGEITALEAKGCDFLVEPSSITHLKNGLAAGGNEIRVMVGKSYMAAKISEDWYAYKIAQDVVTYSDPDINALKSIVEKWALEMASRKLLDKETFVWNFPAASTFGATEKATHTLTLSNVFSANYVPSVNDTALTLDFTI